MLQPGLRAPMSIAAASTEAAATTTSASSAVAIPTDEHGETPRYVVVMGANDSQGSLTLIRFGQSTVTSGALLTNMMVLPHGTPIVVDVSGQTHFCVRTGAGTGTVWVGPLES